MESHRGSRDPVRGVPQAPGHPIRGAGGHCKPGRARQVHFAAQLIDCVVGESWRPLVSLIGGIVFGSRTAWGKPRAIERSRHTGASRSSDMSLTPLNRSKAASLMKGAQIALGVLVLAGAGLLVMG